jgi:hypothetical protein
VTDISIFIKRRKESKEHSKYFFKFKNQYCKSFQSFGYLLLEFSLTNHKLIYLWKFREKPLSHKKVGDEFVFSENFGKINLLYLSEGNCTVAKSKFLSLKKQLKNVGKSTCCNQCG